MRRLIRVSCTVDDCWRAATEPRSLDVWLGSCSQALAAPDTVVSVDTGGRLLTLTVTRFVPTRHLEFLVYDVFARAPQRISFTFHPTPHGVDVEFTLTGDLRRRSGDAAVWELRLRAFVRLAAGVRHDWLQPSIRLCADPLPWSWRALHADTVLEWLPVSVSANGARQLFIVDEVGPRGIGVTEWIARYDESITLVLDLPSARCVNISVSESRHGARLLLEHQGWASQRRPTDDELRLYLRFRDMWEAALHQAAELARSSSAS